MPYALGGPALLVIGQFAAVKLDFQHLAECCPSVQWDESENVVGYAGTGGCAAGVPSHSGCRSNIEVMIVAIDVRITLRRGSRIFAQKIIANARELNQCHRGVLSRTFNTNSQETLSIQFTRKGRVTYQLGGAPKMRFVSTALVMIVIGILLVALTLFA